MLHIAALLPAMPVKPGGAAKGAAPGDGFASVLAGASVLVVDPADVAVPGLAEATIRLPNGSGEAERQDPAGDGTPLPAEAVPAGASPVGAPPAGTVSAAASDEAEPFDWMVAPAEPFDWMAPPAAPDVPGVRSDLAPIVRDGAATGAAGASPFLDTSGADRPALEAGPIAARLPVAVRATSALTAPRTLAKAPMPAEPDAALPEPAPGTKESGAAPSERTEKSATRRSAEPEGQAAPVAYVAPSALAPQSDGAPPAPPREDGSAARGDLPSSAPSARQAGIPKGSVGQAMLPATATGTPTPNDRPIERPSGSRNEPADGPAPSEIPVARPVAPDRAAAPVPSPRPVLSPAAAAARPASPLVPDQVAQTAGAGAPPPIPVGDPIVPAAAARVATPDAPLPDTHPISTTAPLDVQPAAATGQRHATGPAVAAPPPVANAPETGGTAAPGTAPQIVATAAASASAPAGVAGSASLPASAGRTSESRSVPPRFRGEASRAAPPQFPLAAPIGAEPVSPVTTAPELAFRALDAAPTLPRHSDVPPAAAPDAAFGLVLAPTAPGEPVAVKEPPTLDMRRDDWMDGMIDRIEVLRDAGGDRQARLRLSPDALGTVDVAIRHEGDRVHVHISADNGAARTMLADAAPRLAELAEARGLRLGQATVDGGGAQADAQRRQPDAPAAAAAGRRASGPSGGETEPQTDLRIA